MYHKEIDKYVSASQQYWISSLKEEGKSVMAGLKHAGALYYIRTLLYM
jgi:hypothetical protein